VALLFRTLPCVAYDVVPDGFQQCKHEADAVVDGRRMAYSWVPVLQAKLDSTSFSSPAVVAFARWERLKISDSVLRLVDIARCLRMQLLCTRSDGPAYACGDSPPFVCMGAQLRVDIVSVRVGSSAPQHEYRYGARPRACICASSRVRKRI